MTFVHRGAMLFHHLHNVPTVASRTLITTTSAMCRHGGSNRTGILSTFFSTGRIPTTTTTTVKRFHPRPVVTSSLATTNLCNIDKDRINMRTRVKNNTEKSRLPITFSESQLIASILHAEFYKRKYIATTSISNPLLYLDQRRQFSQESDKTGNKLDDPTTPPTNHAEENPRRSRMKVPNFGPESDKAVESLQQARKERARAKTAANVWRAMIGNVVICAAKFGAWMSSGSSSMLSEFIHSVVDCGNQGLLLMGLRYSGNAADRTHPYGYGKSVYFWALVSALGTFFLGAGVSLSHAIPELLEPSLQEISNEVWAVLCLSFGIDGYVLYKTITEIREEKPSNVPLWEYIKTLRDPATLAVLLEDGAACLGIVIAIAGITASHATGMPIFDGMAGVGISVLLGMMGLTLVRVNHTFLIGRGVSREMREDIEQIIRSRRSIDGVYGIQSQWTGPETFSFKAEVDFDGTYLAAELMPRYEGEFKLAKENFDQELSVLLSWYAEDVIRAVEREVRHIEALIRQKYPGAEYIELEPMSKDANRFAIDDSLVDKLLQFEKEEMRRLIQVLHPKAKRPEETAETGHNVTKP